MRIRNKLGLGWIADRLAPYINISGRVPLTFRDEDGLRFFSDGTEEIAGLIPRDGHEYRHGIAKRLQRLALAYGIDRLVKIRPGDVVVNCGANVGTLTLALAKRGARVIAVEPDPLTLRALRHNTAGKPSIEVLPMGLWNSDGELTFYQDPLQSNTSAINEDGPPTIVPVKKLDTVVAERGIERLRLFVGDAEGAEPEVVEGASETLARTDYFAMECGYERRGERTVEKVSELLLARGFEIVQVTRRNRVVARNRTLR